MFSVSCDQHHMVSFEFWVLDLFLFALNVGKNPKVKNHLCSRHVVSQGLQVSCRVSGSSSVGTWAAAVLWLSFPMSWMWNDSLSDADCYTSRISYPWKQMLVSHRGLLFWQKQHEDVWCEVWAQRLTPPEKKSCMETDTKPRTNNLCCRFTAVSLHCMHFISRGLSQWVCRLPTGGGLFLLMWNVKDRGRAGDSECRATSSLFSSL